MKTSEKITHIVIKFKLGCIHIIQLSIDMHNIFMSTTKKVILEMFTILKLAR